MIRGAGGCGWLTWACSWSAAAGRRPEEGGGGGLQGHGRGRTGKPNSQHRPLHPGMPASYTLHPGMSPATPCTTACQLHPAPRHASWHSNKRPLTPKTMRHASNHRDAKAIKIINTSGVHQQPGLPSLDQKAGARALSAASTHTHTHTMHYGIDIYKGPHLV